MTRRSLGAAILAALTPLSLGCADLTAPQIDAQRGAAQPAQAQPAQAQTAPQPVPPAPQVLEPEGESVEASHILIGYTGAPRSSATRTKAEAEAEAQRLSGLARAPGADFAALAKEHSEDPGSGPRGGALGAFTRERMVKPFSDAAFALEVGQVSGPVESQFGYHVILRTK